MMRRPIAFKWWPNSVLGRVLALFVGICLFVGLFVVSLAAISIVLTAGAVSYLYWRFRLRFPAKPPREPQVIDVTPEVINERPLERARDDRAREDR